MLSSRIHYRSVVLQTCQGLYLEHQDNANAVQHNSSLNYFDYVAKFYEHFAVTVWRRQQKRAKILFLVVAKT